MNDTVREELQTKVMPGISPRILEKAPLPAKNAIKAPCAQSPGITALPVRRAQTAGLAVSKTSPTFVEFQNKNASLPDWRLQLQNAVQQRKGLQNSTADAVQPNASFPTNGGAALKAEIVPRVELERRAKLPDDPRVANAMRRIEQSRAAFRAPETAPRKPLSSANAPPRPFAVVSPTGLPSAAAAAPAREMAKPKLVSAVIPAVERRDTNKLPRIEMFAGNAEVADVADEKELQSAGEFAEINRIHIKAEQPVAGPLQAAELNTDEIEDLAPFSMRFGAGLFDLIIGGFAALLLLSPIAFTNGNWFTANGLLTVAATGAIVLFLYMTICLGFFGKTMGMRLFSLELVDAVENEYPTLRQAAVNSSVFLISTLFAGAGFLTVFFNEENRALHDLLSGTIIVREF